MAAQLPFYDSVKLNTPTKRAGYLALLAGGTAAGLSLVAFLLAEYHWDFYRQLLSRDFKYQFESLVSNWSGFGMEKYRAVFYGGLAVSIVGWLLSFGYERTLGKVARWLRTGRT